MCQGSPSRAALGGGTSRPPWAPAGRTKEPCKYVFPCTTLKQHTSPFHGEIILVKREESLYNGCGAVLLLCGRSCLLHRGVGRCELSTSCPYYSPCLYCTAICDGAQAVFSDFTLSGPLFLLFRGWLAMRSGRWWPATDGAGVRFDGWEQGGVKGGFRSIAIPRWRLVVTCRHVPAGIAVALTPCGA